MRTLNEYFLTVHIADLDVAGTIYVPVPDGGRIMKVMSALEAAIAGGDEDLTIKTAQGTVAPVLTITQSGSAAGDVDSIIPTSNYIVEEDGTIEIENDGVNSTSGVGATVTIIIRR